MNLEKTWSLTSVRNKSQLRQQRHWRTSCSSSHLAPFITKMEKRRKYTLLNWNILSRSWKSPRPLHSYSTISNTHCSAYRTISRKLWCWTMTTLKRGVTARFVCSLPIPNQAVSGLIYSATQERQPRRCGLIYHGVQRTTSKVTHAYTAKGKKSRLLYTT